ncbi:sugar transferase [Nodosilinea sp. LEGE 07088]|uniref:Npun_R2821/Npun_R2822 family protein n=1 Tax=Nodosilinea sp. LEGE 07088 TaxID=2777968 RepID=UPI001881ACF5|nr:Npun_R2821/Npun_R2822 family protein [Nodosilinea sp. LEGE 07088]MBE9140228.1 sugar transferase [Nodosilinea sp. LEGE 07088]
MDGICTLGNDRVYDQIVALINSIEVFAGPQMPVCIYPYDDQIERLRELVRSRPQVTLYDDIPSIQRWDAWVEQIWATHPTARQQWDAIGSAGIHRMGTHRRYCAFDGPFDRFIYMDADTLLLSEPTPIFNALAEYDWVTYDFQHRDLSHVYDVNSPWMTQLFSAEQLQRQTFCSGFYASRRGLFDPNHGQEILNWLQSGEAAVLYPMAPDQTILNYLVMRRGINSCNLALTLPPERRTGNAVTSSHFTVENQRVYDKGVPLLYLHYIGLSSKLFARLGNGENIDLPYRDVFLHYRYCHAPETQPALVGRLVTAKPQDWRRYLKPLARLFS